MQLLSFLNFRFVLFGVLWVFLLISPGNISPVQAQSPYPGAQGGGQFVTGGRGGKVLYVNSLEDDEKKPGTLRWAVSQKYPRIILFRVAGIIELKEHLFINQPDVTIAGQSAPGDGICIKGFPVSVNTRNVIIQFIRFRMGDENKVADDALKGIRRKDILIDHCSMSWSTDECSSFYDNENFTMQWCILSESLRISVHGKGDHGYGGIWGGNKATFHHNLLAHHDSRNPRLCGARYHAIPENENVELVNNVFYNWGGNSGYAGEGGQYNIVGNYYKPGPASLAKKGNHNYRIFSPNSDAGDNRQARGVWGRFYVAGNVMHGNVDVTADNWKGIHPANRVGENQTIEGLKADVPFLISDIKPVDARDAYEHVLAKAGASLRRDPVDQRIVNEVRLGTFTFTGSKGSGNGLIDSQTDVGGWPAYAFSENDLVQDSDEDGIPDYWEKLKGLNPADASDGQLFSISKTHTNLETYLFSLVSHLY
jgi:pectate lyase